MSKQYFHFTLGPVQSFVGQARRTRDFWAGSFLLSWLSGVAVQSVIGQGGEILFPQADKNFLDAIKGSGNNKPQQGSIPNRFKAEVNADFNPQQVIDDVQTAWQALANEIYQAEITQHALTNTQNIWDRQVKSFWDMTWVLVDDIEDSSSLDRRKNWRSHYLPDEIGIKCSLMGDWQELSGVVGVRKIDRQQREAFWQTMSQNKPTDFNDKEHLCAISYIKRRFLSYFANFNVKLNQFTAHGWALPNAVPSVSYIAAAPWYGKVLANGENTELDSFFTRGSKLYGRSEYNSTIHCIETQKVAAKYKALDGNAFHNLALDNINITADQEQAKQVKRALKELTDQYGAISPFYAVLMMDGDSLGKQMSDTNKQTAITDGLAKFTAKVPDLVYKNNGFLIYAGGDDVLALVSLEDALSCALAVRQHYEACFKESDIKTSISAAIIYTHINSPLKNILHEAHELLDDIAKEKAGRDALAVRVYKGSGLAVEWANKWDKALTNNQYVLSQLVEDLNDAQKLNEQFSSKFFYKIRQRFDLLYGKDGNQQNPLSAEQAIDLMAMEYLQSVDKKGFTMNDAKDAVTPLIEQSYNAAKDNKITADAALLVRFLAQKGIEGGRS